MVSLGSSMTTIAGMTGVVVGTKAAGVALDSMGRLGKRKRRKKHGKRRKKR